ncbi:hypothetical protein [Herbaspirillum sp. NPDC087042]|uniref:hypothetical protein n=1 Tax=Herbaspirillum sp. NPDC087042 TaxID=3364004 RepID=UPI0038241972
MSLLISALLILFLIGNFTFAIWMIKRRKLPLAPVLSSTNIEQAGMEVFSVLDQDGATVFRSSEIAGIPSYAKKLDPEHELVRRAAHLTADILKGAASISGKSIGLVFKPEIQAGLKDGTYTLMKTTTGETLADAVDVSNKIVGKARIVETGKLKQLASGGFQLASIVVAQSHLADIERSLSLLRQDLVQVLDDLEATNISKITGKTKYLLEMVQYIKQKQAPGELPVHLANSLQSIVAESHELSDKLYEDCSMLIKRVLAQKDPDTWGTEGVYKALHDHIEKANILLARHQTLSHLFATINYVVAYFDPIGKAFFKVNMESERWNGLSDELLQALTERANALLSSAHFNAADTLALRKKDIVRDAEAIQRTALEQQSTYDTAMLRLSSDVQRYFGEHSETHIALTFDSNGMVKAAAVL